MKSRTLNDIHLAWDLENTVITCSMADYCLRRAGELKADVYLAASIESILAGSYLSKTTGRLYLINLTGQTRSLNGENDHSQYKADFEHVYGEVAKQALLPLCNEVIELHKVTDGEQLLTVLGHPNTVTLLCVRSGLNTSTTSALLHMLSLNRVLVNLITDEQVEYDSSYIVQHSLPLSTASRFPSLLPYESVLNAVRLWAPLPMKRYFKKQLLKLTSK